MCNSFLLWMRARLLSVFDKLSTSEAIRKQLLFCMFNISIESQVKRSYERLLVDGVSPMGSLGDTHDAHEVADLSRVADGKHTGNRRHLSHIKVAPYPLFDRNLLLRYEQLENAVMVWMMIKCFLSSLIERSLTALLDTDNDGLLLGMEPTCLMPGKLFMHQVVRDEFTIALSLFLLGYRLVTRYLNKPYDFSAVDFVLQDAETIDQFIDQIEEANIKAEKEGYEGINRALERTPFTKFMCFKVADLNGAKRQDQQEYQLRPNRTREAHSWLTRLVSRVTLVAFGTHFAWALLVGAFPAACALTDFSYLYAYEGCDPEMELEYNSNDSQRWYHFTLSTPHRVIVALADALVTYVLYAGIGTTIIYLFAVPYIMNEDLLNYLRMIDQEIDEESNRRRSLCYHDADRLLGANWLNVYSLSGNRGLSLVSREQASPERGPVSSTGPVPMGKAQFESMLPAMKKDTRLRVLRFELRDFFRQVGSVGELVGDVVSFGLMNWLFSSMLVINAAISYYVKYEDFVYKSIGVALPTALYTFLLCCALPTSYICEVIFRIYNRSLATYRRLACLFAYSHRSRHERTKFCEELIEYYVYQQRNCYKLFNAFPFKATSYLSLIGWTFSLLAILSNLVHKKPSDHLE